MRIMHRSSSCIVDEARAAEALAASPADWRGVACLYEQAAQANPENHRLLGNSGHAFWLADEPVLALAAYRKAVKLAPRESILYRGLGNVYMDLQAYEKANRSYEIGIQLEDTAHTNWNRSQLLIGLEQYEEGYALAEQRWFMPSVRPWRDPLHSWQIETHGWDCPLLLWSEQGLGDTLQHLRWLGVLQRHRSESTLMVLEVEECLVELLRQRLPRLGSQFFVRAKTEESPEDWDGAHLSLLSLPAVLGGAPIPTDSIWLETCNDTAYASGPKTPLKRVGLVWAAGRKLDDPVAAREYWRRSLDDASLEALIKGFASRGVEVVLLQFGSDVDRAAPWRHLASAALPQEANFAETATYLERLDLVVTVDTSMAHLLGVMRFPGWVLLPYSAAPRWLRDRDDTPWYPSLRLFRQEKSGDWMGVVSKVLQAL